MLDISVSMIEGTSLPIENMEKNAQMQVNSNLNIREYQSKLGGIIIEIYLKQI